ncbi:MAG: threonine-phosphate decarboxylase [Magnetococcales bacterium]|nr:threonine-phosphate decarboxylase [Magnetococcales bacterium]MBF0157041.1 threonine-phosphate decarboxylase [Magnetococcales bacterium]
MRVAAAHFGIPPGAWLDLSTGINPLGWRAPLGEMPAAAWSRLPEVEDGLEQAAREYYGSAHLLPVAGSQAAIQVLPRLFSPARVAVVEPTYAEHAHAWRAAGHAVVGVALSDLGGDLEGFDGVVVVNPNNPTGRIVPRARLLDWHGRLAARGGWLVVDEAFMDSDPGESLTPHPPMAGLFVLRSLGKFFGLAGLRVGFLLALPEALEQARELLGPWGLSGPSRWLATRALRDRDWQAAARLSLRTRSRELVRLLDRHGLPVSGHTALFAWVATERSEEWWTEFGRNGILVRRFLRPGGVRFGLPGGEAEWRRLEGVLGALSGR